MSKPIESVEFDQYVLLPNPHGRQQYAHHEKFLIVQELNGFVLTCKSSKREVLVPWPRVASVRYAVSDSPPDVTQRPGLTKGK